MDSTYQAMPQGMGQSPFFYYNPDPKPDNRQHGHFSPHPNQIQVPMYHQQMQPMPSTPIYSRPGSSCSQPPMQSNVFSNYQGMNTPVASPRPMYHKPTILIQEHSPRMLLESDRDSADMYFYPQTPPLSASGSTISSPTYDMLHTPVQTSFPSGLAGLEGFEGVKEGCEGEVQSENLAGGDWARCGSPPMTPVFIHPSSLMAASNAPSEQLLLSACPSLSPSPSPYSPSTISENEFSDFCDPRNLTVGSGQTSNPSLTVEFPPLPTLCQGDDEEHRFMLGDATFIKPEHDSTFNFTVNAPHSIPSFDEFSDIDSENDFVNGLVNYPSENVQYFGNKRQRTSSDLSLSLDHEHFSSEDEFDQFEDTEEFATACLPSPPANTDITIKTEKRSKKAKRNTPEEDSSEFDSMVRSRKYTVPMNSAAGAPAQETSAEGQQNSAAPSQTGSSENNNGGVMNSGSDAGTSGTPNVPVNRRGRKQSLTEDPSKTFVCDLCNRRFRRQEHLKRHYRSLHTADKPFECHECGKKFSRSDNLSQHARTHGSGAIVMGVLEDGELPTDHHGSDPEVEAMGKVLFQAAAQVAGSESSGSDSESRRKRKRSE